MEICRTKFETLLARSGLTQAELAARCGMQRQNLSAIIRRGSCTPKTAGRVAAGLCVDVTELLRAGEM